MSDAPPMATGLQGNLKERNTTSAADQMQQTLDRINEVNGAVNAIVSLRDPDDLLAEARAADLATRRGPLHGVPMAVKDLSDVAGLPTTKGSPLLAGKVPETDDLMVRRLKEAGAIVIGKTNVPEFGLGSHTVNPVFGATRNPYNPALSCGGSSGGAAVALATGMVALADGSDAMGSLRNPAAWNNVYGFRPSWGLVPSEPAGEAYLRQLTTLGPMARCPQDLALLLDVMAGPDPLTPLVRDDGPILPLPQTNLKGKTIGWLGNWDGAFAMEPGILDLCKDGLRVLEGLGADITPLSAPFPADRMWEGWVALRQFDTLSNFPSELIDKDLSARNVLWEIEGGRKLSAQDIQRASEIRSDWFRTCAALFLEFDALVMPVTQLWPFPVDLPYPAEIAGVRMDTYHRWMQVMVPVSLIGLPSLAAPVGFGPNGLPMGFQIFGPKGSDRDILAIGAAYHEATGWPQRRPPQGLEKE